MPSASITVSTWPSTEKSIATNEPELMSRRRYVLFASRVTLKKELLDAPYWPTPLIVPPSGTGSFPGVPSIPPGYAESVYAEAGPVVYVR